MILSLTDDGQTFDVDLAQVSGWDAISYRLALGGNLEDAVLALLSKPAIVLAVDRTLVRWLWARQTKDPLISLEIVAMTVRAIPDPESVPASDAGGEDAAEQGQGEEQGDDQGVDPDLI